MWWTNFSINHPFLAELIESFIGIFVMLLFVALIAFVVIFSILAFTKGNIALGIAGIVFAIFLMALASAVIRLIV